MDMSLGLVLLAVVTAVVAGGATSGSTRSVAPSAAEEEGLGPAEPDDYFLFQRSVGGKLPSTADFERAVGVGAGA